MHLRAFLIPVQYIQGTIGLVYLIPLHSIVCTHLFCSKILILDPSTPAPIPMTRSKTSRIATSQKVDFRSPQRQPRGFVTGLCKGSFAFISDERARGSSWLRVWLLGRYAVGNSSCLVGNSSCLVGYSSCR